MKRQRPKLWDRMYARAVREERGKRDARQGKPAATVDRDYMRGYALMMKVLESPEAAPF